MKLRILLVFLFFINYSFADIPNIGDFCYKDSCSNIQEELWQNFKESKGFHFEEEAVYSGNCYHTSPMYSNSHAHHAMVLIDKNNSELYMSPRFSFYSKNNPYADWDLEKARSRDEDRFNKLKKLEISDEQAFVNMYPNTPPFLMYWLKKDEGSDLLELVGLWDFRHRFICKLRHN